jgi:hypothetical protein
VQFILVEANIIIACIRLCYHWISNIQEEAIALIIFTRHILIHVPGHDTDVHWEMSWAFSYSKISSERSLFALLIWWNRWPSLFKLSFLSVYIKKQAVITYYVLFRSLNSVLEIPQILCTTNQHQLNIKCNGKCNNNWYSLCLVKSALRGISLIFLNETCTQIFETFGRVICV